MLFLLMKQGYASPATELLEFFEERQRDLKKKTRKTGKFFVGKLYKIWNEIDADVGRNLYENYTYSLLDVKEVRGVMKRY